MRTHITRWTLTTISADFVLFLCILVFLGWQFDQVVLRSLIVDAPQTVPLTAVLLLMLALSLLLCQRLQRETASTAWRWGCWGMSGAAVLLSLWIGVQYLLGLGPSEGLLLYRELMLEQSATYPGRPSPHTALTAGLLGLSIGLYATNQQGLKQWGLVLAVTAFAISWIVLFGYANHANPFYSLIGNPEIGMSPMTSLGFTGLIVGVLGLQPDRGVIALLRAPTVGGQVVRILLPVAGLLPLLFGWLVNYGLLMEWMEPAMGFALTWGISSLVYAGLVIWQGFSLHRSDLHRAQVTAEREQLLAELAAASEQIQRVNAELQEQAAALERSNHELMQFAHVASHDLQAPLRSISGFVQLLQADYGGQLDEQADDWMRRIVRATQRLQALIHDLLAYSQVNSRELVARPVALDEVFQEVCTLLDHEIQETGAEISWDPLPTVMGEHTQLVQLVLNLFGNAIKYRSDALPRIHTSVQEQNDMYIFQVKDNGIGIDKAYYEKIFEIFNRLHTEKEYAGTGIGLAICRRIITRHHGHIWLQSTPGAGSTFFFSLPKQSVSPSHKVGTDGERDKSITAVGPGA